LSGSLLPAFDNYRIAAHDPWFQTPWWRFVDSPQRYERILLPARSRLPAVFPVSTPTLLWALKRVSQRPMATLRLLLFARALQPLRRSLTRSFWWFGLVFFS
jgi:hypothetical protein